MRSHFPIALVFVALSAATGIADEVKIVFSGDDHERIGGRIPIEARAIRKDGKVRVVLTNVSRDFIAIAKHAQGWSIKYFSDGEWRDGAGSTFPVDTASLDHVMLRPAAGKNPGQTTKGLFEFPSSHGTDSIAEVSLRMGGYFPSAREYLEFSIIAKIALEPKAARVRE